MKTYYLFKITISASLVKAVYTIFSTVFLIFYGIMEN